jgi:hypothetical protein
MGHLCADLFFASNLNRLNMMPIPYCVETDVREPHHEDVHNKFLAEVMIDSVELRFIENIINRGTQLHARVRVLPEGLLKNEAVKLLRVTSYVSPQLGASTTTSDIRVQKRRHL